MTIKLQSSSRNNAWGFVLSSFLAVAITSFPVAAEPLVGTIVLYGGNTCPGGWLPVDGRELSRAAYPELYAAIGTTYGGGATSFVLPDLSNRFAMGNPDQKATANVGTKGGGRLTGANLPAHAHSMKDVVLSGTVNTIDAGGTTADPSASVGLAKTNRTAAYAAGTPTVGLAAGSVTVTGGEGTATGDNPSNGTFDGYPPFQLLNYCIATGGDTAPLIDVGIQFDPDRNVLVLKRVNYSGFTDASGELQTCIDQGDLCLFAYNESTIGRPNVRITLVGDNLCRAYEEGGLNQETGRNPYPAELRLTGVQVANFQANKADVVWGDHYLQSRQAIASGAFNPSQYTFAYTAKKDANGNPGFLAVDVVSDRTLVFENRNTEQKDFQYRVVAECGDPGSAYEVYFDPMARHSGRGGVVTY